MKGPKVSTVFAALVFMMIFIGVWSGLGMGALLSEMQSDDPLTYSTLAEYDAVEDLSTEDGNVPVLLSSDPRFSSAGEWGDREIDHVQLVSKDGDISTRKEVHNGQQEFVFSPSDGADGSYTLNLIAVRPENPSLFGHPRKEYEQEVEFTINNGELNVTDVPYTWEE